MNIGIIGCGYWGPNLLRNFSALDDVTVVMVADQSADRINFVRKNFPNVKEISQDPSELIKNPNIDAIVIVTPVSTHYRFAKESLLAGKHVFVEKPFTATVAEGEELIEIAEQKKLIIMVDHTFIYTGAVRKIKELIDTEKLGELYYFDSVRVNLGLFQHDVNVIWDLAPHDISIMNYLLNKLPKAVSTAGMSHFRNQPENIAYITAVFDNSLLGHIHVNWLAPVKVRKTLLSGSKKMVVYDDMEPSEKIKIYDRGVDIVREPADIYDMLVQYRTGDMHAPKITLTEALKNVVAEFNDAIHENRQPLTNGQDGLSVVRILEASNLSMRKSGEYVEIKN